MYVITFLVCSVSALGGALHADLMEAVLARPTTGSQTSHTCDLAHIYRNHIVVKVPFYVLKVDFLLGMIYALCLTTDPALICQPNYYPSLKCETSAA